jgi:hypothetical protein
LFVILVKYFIHHHKKIKYRLLSDLIMEEPEEQDRDMPLVKLRSDQAYDKLMKSPKFTEMEKRLMTQIRNTNMTPIMRAVLLGRSGLARKVATMLGNNKTVFQTPKELMRIANNIYTRVNTKKKIIIKSISELSQHDLDASISLWVVKVNYSDYAPVEPININICGTDRWGTKYSIPTKIAIYPHDQYQQGHRDIATIVNLQASQSSYGCIYYVLNATNRHEAMRHIERYANTMGAESCGYGEFMPKFCGSMNLAEVSRRYLPRGGPLVLSERQIRSGGSRRPASSKRCARTQRAHRKRT